MNQYQKITVVFLVCALVTGVVMGALAVWIWQMTIPPEMPAIQVVTVEVAGQAVVETVVVERVITATPEAEQALAAAAYPAPVEATATLQPTPTATAVLADYAEIVSLDVPSDIMPYEQSVNAVIVIRNAGDKTWSGYWIECPAGKQKIEALAPGGEAVFVFQITPGEPTYGEYKPFEFGVFDADRNPVPWLPGGGFYSPLEPVVGVRVWGYKATDLPPEKWADFIFQEFGGKWECNEFG